MNAFKPATATGTPYGNVAYQYLYGRHHQYGRTPSTSRYGARPYWTAKPAPSSSEFQPGLDDGPQTVEDLIEQGYFAVPQSDPETGFLEDKKHTSWMALDDVLGQIRKRHEIYKQNMLDITWSQCYAFNELARHGAPATDEAYAIYEKRMNDLRSEQRAERVSLWRDVSRVRERLPESAQQYLSSFRKLEILGDEGGDDL